MKENKNSLGIIVERLKQEAYELLSETIKDIKEADDTAKQHGVSWTKRHRLCVLLESIEDTQKGLPDSMGAPWFLAELMTTLDVIRRWRDKSCWEEIEHSLKNPNDFKHTILTLQVAEHLIKAGYKVEIVPIKGRPTPDLMLHATGGTQDLVHIECYQPEALCGKTTDISAKKAKRIVKTSKAKALRQLGNETPGLLAICGYNQSRKNLILLEEAIEKGLQKTSQSNLGGILIVTIGVKVDFKKEGMSFNAIRSLNFISNPNYFGGVEFEYKTPKDDPNLIDEPLIDINSDSIMSGDINLITNLLKTTDIGKKPIKKIKKGVARTRKLNIIEEPKKLSRAIVHSTSNKVPPMFKGDGNINFLCGHCEVILAECVWDPSISNIVIECPSCQSFNEFPILSDVKYNKVKLTNGNYNFSGPVVIGRGKCIEGLLGL